MKPPVDSRQQNKPLPGDAAPGRARRTAKAPARERKPTDPDLLTTAEAAELLRTTTTALHCRVYRGAAVPEHFRDGKRLLWPAAGVQKFIDEQLAGTKRDH